jgi:hypothetical protein
MDYFLRQIGQMSPYFAYQLVPSSWLAVTGGRG